MEKRSGIVWFRQDLRIHDNEALTEALKFCAEVIPVFIFDERTFLGKTKYGFPKTGKFRAKFIIECVEDLKKSLKKLGADLIVRVGNPAEEIFKIAREVRSSWVFCNRERTQEEVKVQDALERKLWTVGQEIRYSRGKMLYYTADLPFPITHTPDIFAHFKKEVERFVPVRNLFSNPTSMPISKAKIEKGSIPKLADFGHKKVSTDKRGVLKFKGGETAALERLTYYFGDLNLPKKYKNTRDDLIGPDYSTKFSAWLSQGCISPKRIFQELKKFEAEKIKNKSTQAIFFDLMWRDFLRLMAKKYENKIFLESGPREKVNAQLSDDKKLLSIWIKGRTGIPFIDANMREVAATGFMSNRGRQNVASFLINDLKVNWLMGAEYFESILIDYDPASNYGNWNYLAGVGADLREDHHLNIASQAKKYDPNGDYVKLWLPELKNLPKDRIHYPGDLSVDEQEIFNLKIGADYPRAMVRV